MKKRIYNTIGAILILFLGIVKFFWSDEFSLITTGLGGFICVIISFSLFFYPPFEKPNKKK
ncbi:MAG TPA: hypothetical protein VNR61_11180 [Niallia sp.]|nr:hypothetical protein [Niallia sp.]